MLIHWILLILTSISADLKVCAALLVKLLGESVRHERSASLDRAYGVG
jgi:hypothetical protein